MNHEQELARLKNQFSAATKVSQEQMSRILAITHLLEPEKNEMVARLMESVYRLLVQNINMSYCFSDELLPDSQSKKSAHGLGCNLAKLVSAEQLLLRIVGECRKLLESAKTARHGIKLELECSAATIRIDEKAFTVAIMNLLQNAFLYSPPKSTVIVKLSNTPSENGELVTVSVTNLVGHPAETLRTPLAGISDESAGLGIPLCEKITAYYGGNFEIVNESNGNHTTKMSFPLVEYDYVENLKSDYDEYVSERYKPVHIFMQVVLESGKD
jgi:signal transduction histidine kinase